MLTLEIKELEGLLTAHPNAETAVPGSNMVLFFTFILGRSRAIV